MFNHIMLGANSVEESKAFYDATLGVLGAQPGRTDPKGRALYVHGGGVLMLSTPIDGAPACHANGGTVGFAAADPETVDAWHAAGLAHGGTAIEDPPGVRQGSFGKLYLAYLRDPTGNKVCAVFRYPA
jgi:catechol 2,3-dioxygenase-like lactoylglutathione lyase family enzyme